jgi:LacI family transcriptional regulator
MNMNKRSTIKQVAKAAGVSTQTVSRVINDRPDVAPETREHIQQIIQELGYQPSALARSLIQQRSYTLGVVTAGLQYNGPSRTLNGITSKAEELGYALLLKELSQVDTKNIGPVLQTLLARHVDGIVWAVHEIGDNRRWTDDGLMEMPVPVVFLNMENRPNLSIVNYDNYQGAQMATGHLFEQGYRHIGHISGPLDWWESRERKAGWQKALTDAGVKVLESHWVAGNWSSASGEASFRQLQTQYPEMDAVFVGNDQMALSVMKVSSQEGLSIPSQLGVVGFDGLAETAYYSPPLTTVVQDQHSLGCTAVEEIVQAIEYIRKEGTPPPSKTIVLQPELLVRESSMRIPEQKSS